MRCHRITAVALLIAAVGTSCTQGEGEARPPANDTAATSTPATAVPTTSSPTTAPSPTTTVTTTTTIPATTTTVPPDDVLQFGTSVQGRPLEVIRRGDPNGRRVLVVGVIHGNEAAGAAIVDDLRSLPVPPGVELWLVPSLNPDGQAINDRQNANGVDLNRNFPAKWAPLGTPGVWQYGGPAAASEPETQAMVALGESIQPDLVLWYHQDLFRISPGQGRDGAIRARYAELTGLPLVEVTGGTYTGTAPQWARTIVAPDGVGFTVELGDTLSPDEAARHATAVLTVASELSSFATLGP